MMFLPYPINEKPKIEADNNCFALTVVKSKPDPEFSDLAQFSNWIESQLAELENRFIDFETQSSRKSHFQR